ncbi:glutathione S-transferase C-terminal domain-containing protein [Kiloniella laminariae]|uniref:Glutathione S-transferase C-terminal domain-containing protein n=1 Tax=Kiloniella laminariae TaxID=454162 RepID=A0ABT4LP14_9PROT|nr:glutathione S-transferase C-terminal domain-containing protein [Kiloniella laminariae]MCZ4282880.1 glutathione S-transferase C-terminal domain-containing protein [Kiloniella laminariae]
MGMLVKGLWQEEDQIIQSGVFVRPASIYAQEIPTEVIQGLIREPGRYHLIASGSCQWSHRAVILRHLMKLQDYIPLHLAHGPRLEGYAINGGADWQIPGSQKIPLSRDGIRIKHLHQLYSHSVPDYTGRVTVPLLWDSWQQKIISNESAMIMQAFDATSAFLIPAGVDYSFFPAKLESEMKELDQRIYHRLGNGVYRAGFAQSQEAYDVAIDDVFSELDELENHLRENRFLFGDIITASDWKLFTTLVRFDSVYYHLHRCTKQRLIDYPSLWSYSRELYSWPVIFSSVDFSMIRDASYKNDTSHNPTGIIPVAPAADWLAPHNREKLSSAMIMTRSGEKIPLSLLFRI